MKVYIFFAALFLAVVSGFAQSEDKGPVMVMVEGGEFRMGNDYSQNSDERPERNVTLNSFQISKYEITNAEYTKFCKVIGIQEPKGEPDNPVVNVTWEYAVMYCNWLSNTQKLDRVYEIIRDSSKVRVTYNKTANGYRLPTEAEWEYAARGGKNSKYYAYSGSNSPDEVGWNIINSGNRAHKVGDKKPNELDIYDMTGNAMEWCFDYYKEDFYNAKENNNPVGPNNAASRVCRGGNFMSRPEILRNTRRFNLEPNGADGYVGIRLVRNQ